MVVFDQSELIIVSLDTGEYTRTTIMSTIDDEGRESILAKKSIMSSNPTVSSGEHTFMSGRSDPISKTSLIFV